MVVSERELLQDYCKIRHDCEMFGLCGPGELLEEIVWKMFGLEGNPQDDQAIARLNHLLVKYDLPEYKDIRY